MRKKNDKDLLDLLRELEEKSELLRDTFDDCMFLDREISTVWDLIDEKYSLPKNDDNLSFIISDYGTGGISKKKLLKILSQYGKSRT